MSHKEDIERAKSGTIFRDGKLRNKEEWYALHPNKQMLAEQQSIVKGAVAAELERKFTEEPYFCTKCKRTHKPGSKVYQAHKGVANESSV